MSSKLNAYFLILFTLTTFTYQQDAFRLLQLNSGHVMIISYSSIYLQNKNTTISPTVKINLDSLSSLQTSDEHKLITIKQYPDDINGYILCRIKQYIYLIAPDLSSKCYDSPLPSTSVINNAIIVPYKKNENSFIYFVCYLVENVDDPLRIQKYTFNKDSCTNVLDNSLNLMPKNLTGNIIRPQGICLDCNLMYNDILTCFFPIVNIYKIGYISFDIKNNLTLLQEFSGSNGIGIEQGSWLRTTQSKDKTKIFCCIAYTNNEIYCSIYDITKNKWSNEVKVFEGISTGTDSFYLIYFNETNEYLIYSNAGNEKKIDVVKFNKNYELISINISYDY